MRMTTLERLDRPLVSIVICSYNHARFLERAIRSAVEQTLLCEVVIVDDGSNDDSASIAGSWMDRVKVIVKPNGGQTSIYECGFAETIGDVLIFLESDEFLYPEAAETVAGLFDEGVAKVHFRLGAADADDQATELSLPIAMASGDVLTPMLATGVLYASAPTSGNAYRRDVLSQLFPLPSDPLDPHGADLFLAYGSAFFGTVVAAGETLGGYRIHADSPHSRQKIGCAHPEQSMKAKARYENRLIRFRQWIDQRTEHIHRLPERFLDFESQKCFYASDILQGAFRDRLQAIHGEAPWLLKAIWGQATYGLPRKLALSAWVYLVAVLPKPIAEPIARYVCDPDSRDL